MNNRLALRIYDRDACQKIVKEKYEHLIRAKFGNYVQLNFDQLYQWGDFYPDTPRLRAVSGLVPCATFYYTEFLTELQPEIIYDIGCGINFFKDILPNVVGIDGVGDFFDINDIFDDDFIKGHQQFFKAVMSVNALHFIPLTYFKTRIIEFSSVIDKFGRGYIALNTSRMFEHTSPDDKKLLFGTHDPSLSQIASFIDAELKTLCNDLNFLVIENIIEKQFDDCIDGNIRLVIEK